MDCILSIDKDTAIHEKTAAEWGKYGISVIRVDTMQKAIKQLTLKGNYLFIIINEDTIPGFITKLSTLRNITDTPIFVMSSTYTVEKTVKAMSNGADAYGRLPDQPKHNVLLALEVLKAQERWAKRPHRPLDILIHGEIILSKTRRKVFVNDFEVSLGKKEFDILETLMSNYGCVMEHKQLLEEIWGETYSEKDADVLWRTINRLRVKLSEQYPVHEYIKIERGVGYVFEL